MTDVLVGAEALMAELDGERPPVLLDVRWALGGPPGVKEYQQGHLPGAVFVDLDTELASHGAASDGRHPLPDVADLQSTARSWGVTSRSRVVAYDATGNLAAARAWWLLRWGGHADVRLLDGGLQAWVAAGGHLSTSDVMAPRGDVVLSAGHLPTLEVGDVATFDGALLDARAAERFRGETEPIDPRAGHVPGALSYPTTENLAADRRFLPAEALRERFAAVADRDVAVYCGSGVTAAHQVAALAVAGIDASLWPGSWSQWSNQDRPVATGPE